jgi:hypothetical protein
MYGTTPLVPTAPMSPPLASAFLALADAEAPVDQRTRTRVLASAVSALVLALGAPLAFLSLGPTDHPVGALSSKSSVSADDE